MLILLGIAAIVGVVAGLAKRKSDQITASVLSRSMPLILRQVTPQMRAMDVGTEGDAGLLNEYVEQQGLGGGSFRNTIHMKKIAYREDGILKRSVHDWVNGDVNFPHVVTRANMLVYTAGDGMRRICPTRDPLRWVSIGAPYLKPSTTWNKVSLGTPTRSGNALTWTTAQAKVNVVMGGHMVDLSCEFLGGWQPPNGQIAFPVGMSGLTRVGSVFYQDGVPVLTLRPFQMVDAANPMDVRAVTTELVKVGTQWYALATLPSLVGMARPVLDPQLILQPDAAGMDTYLWQANPDNNYGGANPSYIQWYSTVRVHSLLQFDVSSIPAGATVTSALLTLAYAVHVGTNVINLYRCTQAWTELGATWNKYNGVSNWALAGGDYDNATVHATQTISTAVSFIQSITALVQGWVSGTWPNTGMLLRDSTEAGSDRYYGFKTSDDAIAAYRPKLVIEYTEPVVGGGSRRWLPLMVARRCRG